VLIKVNLKIFSLIFCLIFLTGMRLPMQNIVYTVEIIDTCKKPIKGFELKYDGEQLSPASKMNLSYIGGASYTMPMNIPNIATVSWQEENGSKHKYDVPLRSLIKTKDIIGSKFKIIFGVCDSKLSVFFAKKTGQFEYSEKEIWSSKKKS